jgi:hypothetical protein
MSPFQKIFRNSSAATDVNNINEMTKQMSSTGYVQATITQPHPNATLVGVAGYYPSQATGVNYGAGSTRIQPYQQVFGDTYDGEQACAFVEALPSHDNAVVNTVIGGGRMKMEYDTSSASYRVGLMLSREAAMDLAVQLMKAAGKLSTD